MTYPLYDAWIAQGLNNAQLASIATYYDCVPGFRRMLAAQDNDLPRFYVAVRELSKLPRARRHAQLCGTGAATVTGAGNARGRDPAGALASMLGRFRVGVGDDRR